MRNLLYDASQRPPEPAPRRDPPARERRRSQRKYQWPASRLNAELMHRLHLASLKSGRPISWLLAEAVERLVGERFIDDAVRAEDERVAEGPADAAASP